MSGDSSLSRLEEIIDASGVSERIEAMPAVGVRPRQLKVRTLLLGVLLALSDARPAHLRRVHGVLTAPAEPEQRRLGVIAPWRSGPHLLTYRQVERTFGLVVGVLSKQRPDGEPSGGLEGVADALLEASVQVLGPPSSSALAVDWTDYESFHRPPRRGLRGAGGEGGEEERLEGTDPEASWGHRRGDGPGQKDEAFFGYYLQAATIVQEEKGPEVAELTRRILITSCHVDPPGAFLGVLERLAKEGIALGDVPADCGYSYRAPQSWAMPLRLMGAKLIQDIHPGDRGLKGAHMGALIWGGNLYCPATPGALLELQCPAPGAGQERLAEHDRLCAELARYKLGPVSSRDDDGFHRVICPAAQGKLRCPHRPSSMGLSYERPQVSSPPEHPPPCCVKQTITVPATVNAKTAQKHDWPSKAFRRSYRRRSASERAFSTVKDPAAADISAKGWCRLAGLTGPSLFLAALFVVRNVRVGDAFAARQADRARRAACGRSPARRKRRRQSAHELIAAANAPPA